MGEMKNGNQAATKQDLAELEQRLTERFQEAIHDSETRLLKAFYGYTEAAQKLNMPPAS